MCHSSKMDMAMEFQRDEEEELVDQIELEMRKIHLTVEKLYNNICLADTENPVQKNLILNHVYSLKLHELDPEDVDDADEVSRFENSLQQELKCLTSDIENQIIKINERNELCNRMEQNLDELKVTTEAYGRNLIQQIDDITKNIKIRFRKEKAELQAIVSCLSSDNSDIQDLIAKITEHHFTEGSDKYLQLEESDNIFEHVEFLKRTALFEVSPQDPLQIRLADLI